LADLTTVQIRPLILTLLRNTSAKQSRRRLTPRFCAEGVSGVTTVETCVGATA